MGVPLFCEGVGCLLQAPFLCGLPHCLCTPLRLAFIQYADIHLSHRERTRYPNYIERRNREPGSHHHRHGSVGAGPTGLADRTAAHLAAGR
nr:MAG TPA: Type I modular polyketide synthase, ethylhmalonyl-coenzyme A, polyketide, TRANSFERASE.78A [Caudoviricetes sp.]